MSSKTGSDSRFPSFTAFDGLRAALLQHPAVHEAVVLNRRDAQGMDCTVAYVVPADVRSMQTLPADMRNRLPPEQLPGGYVFLPSLPIDADGRISVDQLQRYEVIDEDLMDRWKRALNDVDAVHQVEVIQVENSPAVGFMHRTELLPKPGAHFTSNAGTVAAGARPLAAAGDRHKDGYPVVPALAQGEALVESADDPQTLGEALRRAAERHGENGIVYVRPDGSKSAQSYPQLLEEAEQMLAGLSALGLRPGDKVILQLADGREFLTAFWACVLGGMVPAPFSIASNYAASNATVQRLFNAWQLLERPLILAGDGLVSGLRSALGLAGAQAGRVQPIGALPKAGAVPRHEARPDDLTLILFTSGSTGVPKGVMHSHRSLLCMARGTAQQNGFSDRDVTLNWMPLEHVGAISFLHTLPVALGCRQVHVPTEYILQDPLRWLDLMDQSGASISWGPNFAFNLVNERLQELPQRRWNLYSMRFLVSAGELIVSNTTRRFLDLLAPHGFTPTALRPAFGMSETCSGITWSQGYRKDANDADSPFVDLGPPIPSASLRIVGERDQLLNEGEIGRLQLKGASVTAGYYQNPEANGKAFTEDGWFDTGDLGFLRDGCLTLTGREKDEIVINGINYVAAEIEAVVDAVEGVEVSYSGACAVRRPGSDTDELAIFFCPSSDADLDLAETLRAVRRRMATDSGVSPTYVVPLAKAQVPKTAIGKIQRAELRRRFESGEFDAMLKRADLLTDTNTIPEWFHRKIWLAKEASARLNWSEVGPLLVFVDALGLGEALCAALRAAGRRCVVVEAGEDFLRLAHDRYRIDPKSREHYRRLIEALRDDDLPIERIVHLWTCDEASAPDTMRDLVEAQQRGVYSVLYLAQALAGAHDGSRRMMLHVISRGAQVTSGADACDCRHSTVIGLLKTIPEELNWLRCRHVDLEPDSIGTSVAHVLDELRSLPVEDEVAYRNRRRLAWRLARVDMRRGEPLTPRVKTGGIYLITGGLGGIGAYLAAALIRDYRARLILVGTTRLPDRAEWDAQLARGGKLADRIHQYREIESLGGEVVYECADVADEARLEEIVAAAETRWDERLAGVFHLAAGGDVASHWQEGERNQVASASVESFDLLFRSKVYGTWALHRIVRQRPDAIMVCFGSVLGIFGAARLGAYVAAHTFMRNFTLDQRYRRGMHSYDFSWTVWQGMGLSKADPPFAKDFYRALGYFLIPKELGLDSLLAGLARDLPDLIVGIDAGNVNIRKRLAEDVQPLRKLVAYFTARPGVAPGQIRFPPLLVHDRFGAPSDCPLTHLEAMPVNAAGRIDSDALRAMAEAGNAVSGQGAQPETEAEKQIATVWCDVLGRQPGARDSFFQLGGNSLSATQAISRINELFQTKLEVRDMFEHGTVRELAQLVAQRREQRATAPERDLTELMDVDALLSSVDEMSDEQVAELLQRMRRAQEIHP